MPEFSGGHPELLADVDHVVDTVLVRTPILTADQFMIVGAWCRDLWHHSLGHSFATAATRDLDLAISVDSWSGFAAIAESFPRVGDSGIRFVIGRQTVDVLPFGDIEDPTGIAQPPTRAQTMSVWGFREVFAASLLLDLPTVGAVRLPTVAGYVATKLAAWLDRSAWYETKDAADLALALHWYAESAAVHDRLYDTTDGQQILLDESLDVPRAAARLLGTDVAELVGTDRADELRTRWRADQELLVSNLMLHGAPASRTAPSRRAELLSALTRGLQTG